MSPSAGAMIIFSDDLICGGLFLFFLLDLFPQVPHRVWFSSIDFRSVLGLPEPVSSRCFNSRDVLLLAMVMRVRREEGSSTTPHIMYECL